MLRSGADQGSTSSASVDRETDGLASLYRRHSDAIRRHIERQFGLGPADPEDAVQAAFERFAGILDKSEIKDPAAFLRRSARNFVLDQYRAAKTRSTYVRLEQSLGEGTDELDAEHVLSAKERLDVLRAAIGAMDERRREVLIMHRLHGLNCADIARRLGCSPTLVKMRLAEAVTLCQRALRAADGDA
jgi:RNA polymerase sigma factor (sigma-70 family)